MGTQVSRNYWPWLAALTFKSNDPERSGMFFCGGTLVSMKSIITAAHCMQEKRETKRKNPSDFDVQLGRHNLKDEKELS